MSLFGSPIDGYFRRLLWMALSILILASLWLACSRIYQVDEAQTVYMAAVIAHKWQTQLFTSGQLHLLPLSLLVRPGLSSSQLFLEFRLAFWALAWVNAALAVLASGIRLRSLPGLAALILVSTLAPWWSYALECRHDNILLTCLLLLWILARHARTLPRPGVFFGLGALSLLAQACLFKSIASWAPLSILLLLMEPASLARRAVLAACWGSGALAMGLLAHALRAWSGLLGSVDEGARALGNALDIKRFLPGHALAQLVQTAPLLAAAGIGLCVFAVIVLVRMGPHRAWDRPGMPETALFLVGLAAFLANPTPFPYNLLVPSVLAMVALLSLGAPLLEQAGRHALADVLPLALAGLSLWILPPAIRVFELASMDNDGQEAVMDLAEAYTGSEDPVFDAIGLVPTRKAPSYLWLINLANTQLFTKVSMTRSWAGQVPPVVIPSYRFGYLQPADLDFIRSNYLPIRKDVYLLGQYLEPGKAVSPWNCLRSGRYAVIAAGGGTPSVVLDGKRLEAGFHEIQSGSHTLGADGSSSCAVVWAGPNLAVPPRMLPQVGMGSVCPVPITL